MSEAAHNSHSPLVVCYVVCYVMWCVELCVVWYVVYYVPFNVCVVLICPEWWRPQSKV